MYIYLNKPIKNLLKSHYGVNIMLVKPKVKAEAKKKAKTKAQETAKAKSEF